MKKKVPDRFRLWVYLDPIFGHPDWQDYGTYFSMEEIAAKIKEIMEDFRDSKKDLNRYVSIEPMLGDNYSFNHVIYPSEVLEEHYGDWVDKFDACMNMCEDCIMWQVFEAVDERTSNYVCRKGKSWFGKPECKFFEDISKYGLSFKKLNEAIEMTKEMMKNEN